MHYVSQFLLATETDLNQSRLGLLRIVCDYRVFRLVHRTTVSLSSRPGGDLRCGPTYGSFTALRHA